MQFRLSKRFSLVLFISFILSLVAVSLIPRIDFALNPSSKTPSFITYLGVGLTLVLFTGMVLQFGLRSKLGFSKKFLLFTFIYNALIILAKFSLGPFSLYFANLSKGIRSTFLGVANLYWLAYISSLVFLLYLLVLFIFHKYWKKKISVFLSKLSEEEEPKQKSKKRIIVKRLLVVLMIPVMIVTGGSPFFIPFFLSFPALEYLIFLFSTVYGLMIAASLVGALYFAKKAFGSVSEQAIMIRDATLLASFFWVGLSFLLIYHALWVVYILLLMTLWPLRTYTPK